MPSRVEVQEISDEEEEEAEAAEDDILNREDEVLKLDVVLAFGFRAREHTWIFFI